MLLQIDEREPVVPDRLALWDLGFRPFYLLAAAEAALAVPLWAAMYLGWLGAPAMPGMAWHAHEMVFGYTLAVIVGFLFTAGRNWSGQPTPSGRALMALALLWLAARVLLFTPWAVAAALANVAFPLAAAVGLARALVAGKNRRNYFFVGLLLVLALAAAAVHAAHLGWLRWPGALGVQVALDVVLVIITVMAGRVVPMFTNNGVPRAHATRHPGVERAVIGSAVMLLALDFALGASGAGSAAWANAALLAVATAAALAHGARWWLWHPRATLGTPLVWVLHAAYAFVVLHLALRALAAAGWVPPGLAVHAFTVGAIGLLTLGMMTRSARGHTARPLRADGFDIAAYSLVLGAAIVRVGWPLVRPEMQLAAVGLSALMWSAAFTIFFLHYAPWLARPRLDGQPG